MWASGSSCGSPSAPPSCFSPRSSEHPQKRRASSDQEPEIIPAATAYDIVDRELPPDAEEVNDQENPGRDAVPDAPQEVLPPHAAPLVLHAPTTVQLPIRSPASHVAPTAHSPMCLTGSTSTKELKNLRRLSASCHGRADHMRKCPTCHGMWRVFTSRALPHMHWLWEPCHHQSRLCVS